MSDRYQDPAAQAHQAIGRARHWLERLAQLAQFENIVLRPGVGRGGRGSKAADSTDPGSDVDSGPS